MLEQLTGSITSHGRARSTRLDNRKGWTTETHKLVSGASHLTTAFKGRLTHTYMNTTENPINYIICQCHGTSMERHGMPWNSTEAHGMPWHSMVFHGSCYGAPWGSMGLHGVAGFMEFHGVPQKTTRNIPWASMARLHGKFRGNAMEFRYMFSCFGRFRRKFQYQQYNARLERKTRLCIGLASHSAVTYVELIVWQHSTSLVFSVTSHSKRISCMYIVGAIPLGLFRSRA